MSVIIFFKETLVVRIYPNLERAMHRYCSKHDRKLVIFADQDELSRHLSAEEVRYYHKAISDKTYSERPGCLTPPEGLSRDDEMFDYMSGGKPYITERLWALMIAVGDQVKELQAQAGFQDDTLFTVRLDRMRTDDGMTRVGAYNRQKKQICEALIELNLERPSEEELTMMMVKLVKDGRLKTKQDPWRIFRYYAPELGDDGYLYYPQKRHKLEDHTDNIR